MRFIYHQHNMIFFFFFLKKSIDAQIAIREDTCNHLARVISSDSDQRGQMGKVIQLVNTSETSLLQLKILQNKLKVRSLGILSKNLLKSDLTKQQSIFLMCMLIAFNIDF